MEFKIKTIEELDKVYSLVYEKYPDLAGKVNLWFNDNRLTLDEGIEEKEREKVYKLIEENFLFDFGD